METFKNQETCKPYFENAYGYAVFESITKVGIAFIGGAHGDGNVYILNQNQNQNQSGVDNDNDDGDSSSKYKKVGTSSMFQASIGPQLGGQVYIMIIFFETKREYQQFITTANFEFGIDANVVALTASAGAAISTIDNNIGVSAGISGTTKEYSQSLSNTLQYMKGMAIFTSTIGGLMYEASLSGQKYNFTPINDDE
jgi:lipid-binding SYLF domain-containing protein